MLIEKEHKESTLLSRTKQELVNQIMWLEHNNNVLQDTINIQAENFIKSFNPDNRNCKNCIGLGKCAIHDNFNIDYCSDFEYKIRKQ